MNDITNKITSEERKAYKYSLQNELNKGIYYKLSSGGAITLIIGAVATIFTPVIGGPIMILGIISGLYGSTKFEKKEEELNKLYK
ncbi:MAG: hypothetical protein ABIC91_05835 [Nanoarchaeota archaeon]|nr:hypothetical protein [Nanoarchaeota archaeon]MBU1030969.1 hypothetical protein [Nanoarchaeota archaeon]MBU1850166.1 hypothetical protein [Nanoarchaeota archaeon]